MGFDSRGYYYRARKVNGRVQREYFGSGVAAVLAAEMDREERAERERKRAESRKLRQEIETADSPLSDLIETTGLLARAVLLAAGYRQHKRGEWRKKRGNRTR